MQWPKFRSACRLLIDLVPMRSILLKPMKKKLRLALETLQKVPDLDEHERILFARSLSATPDERWQMNLAHLRSLGFSMRSAREEFAFNSQE